MKTDAFSCIPLLFYLELKLLVTYHLQDSVYEYRYRTFRIVSYSDLPADG